MKKIILAIISIGLLSIQIQAQNLLLVDEHGQDVSNTTISIFGTPDDGILVAHFSVYNNSNETINVKVSKTEVDVDGHSENYFCWGNCFAPSVFDSPIPIEIGAGEMNTEDFHGDYNSNASIGESIILYTFYNEANPDDKTTVTIVFDVMIPGNAKNITLADENGDVTGQVITVSEPTESNSLKSFIFVTNNTEYALAMLVFLLPDVIIFFELITISLLILYK